MTDATTADRRTAETTELLQTLIRNRCVNDGTADSGEEVRNADTLEAYLGEGTPLTFERYEPHPGRVSTVTRIEGSDPAAPTLCLMGHTDVVPVNEATWSRDPFGGELVDGEVWGRGAIDMLNLTASMAVAVKHLATSGWRPRGTLIYLGVADEEAGGAYGAGPVVRDHWDAVGCDYVLTESGGFVTNTAAGPRVLVAAAEKGIGWRRLTVRGTSGHGSMPLRSDNAVVKAAEVVRRLAAARPAPELNDYWRAYVTGLGLPPELQAALLDPARLDDALAELSTPVARMAHAITHMTISPNVVHGGQKTNTIPDEVSIDVDVRTLPGQTEEDVRRVLEDALGDLAAEVDTTLDPSVRDATETPREDPLWQLLVERCRDTHAGAEVIPMMLTGGTDASFFRDAGAVAYGAGLFSTRSPWEEFAARFHGDDERLDVESLGLSTQLWIDVANDLLG